MAGIFLTAHWRYLAILSYEVDPVILAPFIPAGTELDAYQGKTFVSMVAFQFVDTRVLGIAVPFHRNFDEINLRFYVTRKVGNEIRRGVVFIKEIVPRWAIAFVANTLYHEKYLALPTQSQIEFAEANSNTPEQVTYKWRFNRSWNQLEVQTAGVSMPPAPGSCEEFIAEHYWGYTKQTERRTIEYHVDHPPWNIWHLKSAQLTCDIAELYGGRFAEFINGEPASAFLAEGSEISVSKPTFYEPLAGVSPQ